MCRITTQHPIPNVLKHNATNTPILITAMEDGNTSTNSGGAAADRAPFPNQPHTSQPDGTATVSHSKPQVDGPMSTPPPTLEQVKAAIPEHGIPLNDLFMLFKPFGMAVFHFCDLVDQAGEHDPVTKLTMPRRESGTSPQNIPVTRQPDGTPVLLHSGAHPEGLAPPPLPTLDQVKAAIPEHGIPLEELSRLFDTMQTGTSVAHFLKLVAKAGKQDPSTNLIIPKKRSKAAHKNTSVTAQPNGTAATFHSGAQADGPAPVVPPTLEEVKAAIPEEGITLSDLVRLFRRRVTGKEAISHFIELVTKSSKQDPATKLLLPK